MGTLRDKNNKVFHVYNVHGEHSYPYFDGLYLRTESLPGINLSGAHLRGVNFKDTNLDGANLSKTNLKRCKFDGSSLMGVNLKGATLPPPSVLLLANWGSLSKKTTQLAMMHDCVNLPDGKKLFAEWARSGSCPFEKAQFTRAVNFDECIGWWDPKVKVITALQLFLLIAKECRVKLS